MTGGLTGGRLDFVLYRRYSRCWRTGTNKSPVFLRDQVETPVSFFDPIVFFDPKESCRTLDPQDAGLTAPSRNASTQSDGSLERPDRGRHFVLSRSRPAATWRELYLLQSSRGG